MYGTLPASESVTHAVVPDLSFVRWSSHTEAAFHSNLQLSPNRYVSVKEPKNRFQRIDSVRLKINSWAP
jgi:hypothetical protein